MANYHMMSSFACQKKEGGAYRPLQVQQRNHLEVDRLQLLNPPGHISASQVRQDHRWAMMDRATQLTM
jgi:hypothetical protein